MTTNPEPIEIEEAYLRGVSAKPDKDGILVCSVSFQFDVKHGDEARIGEVARLLRQQVRIAIASPQLTFEDAISGAIADSVARDFPGASVSFSTGEVAAR